LPFNKFPGVDPILGPEMKSTGEVMGVGDSFAEAFAKAQLAAGDPPPRSGTLLISVRDVDKPGAGPSRADGGLGFDLAATGGTADALEAAGLDRCAGVKKVLEGRPHIVDMIKNDEADIIVNTTEGGGRSRIRRRSAPAPRRTGCSTPPPWPPPRPCA
jgi:carbamoyl-phosphate synthase large subunit